MESKYIYIKELPEIGSFYGSDDMSHAVTNQLVEQGYVFRTSSVLSTTGDIVTWHLDETGAKIFTLTNIIFNDDIIFTDHFVAIYEYRGLNLKHGYEL